MRGLSEVMAHHAGELRFKTTVIDPALLPDMRPSGRCVHHGSRASTLR